MLYHGRPHPPPHPQPKKVPAKTNPCTISEDLIAGFIGANISCL